MKSQQIEVMRILDSKKIEYKLVDISQGEELRVEMRNKSGNPTAVPPQLFNEDKYCGVSAVHCGKLERRLSLLASLFAGLNLNLSFNT